MRKSSAILFVVAGLTLVALAVAGIHSLPPTRVALMLRLMLAGAVVALMGTLWFVYGPLPGGGGDSSFGYGGPSGNGSHGGGCGHGDGGGCGDGGGGH